MLIIDRNGEHLKSLCVKLQNYVSHSIINDFLYKCNIDDISRKTQTVKYGYIPGDNKTDRLYNNFANQLNKGNEKK